MWPNYACYSLLVSGKLIREHPGLVEQIVKTQINAIKYAVEHLDEVAEV
jgi:NitT/TauT family transport system substrate-binding protein